jgi:hypothetical protein
MQASAGTPLLLLSEENVCEDADDAEERERDDED